MRGVRVHRRYGYVPLGHPSFRFFPSARWSGHSPSCLRERRAALWRRQRSRCSHGPARRAVRRRRRRHARPAHDLAPVPRPAARARDGLCRGDAAPLRCGVLPLHPPRGGAAPPGGGRRFGRRRLTRPSAWSWCCHRHRGVAALASRAPAGWDRGGGGRSPSPDGAFLCGRSCRIEFLLPLRSRRAPGSRGSPIPPPPSSRRQGAPPPFRTALHVPWILSSWCCRARSAPLPASYGVFAAGVVLAALSGTNLDSFERYALSASPGDAASTLTGPREVERAVLALSRQHGRLRPAGVPQHLRAVSRTWGHSALGSTTSNL